MQPSQQLIQAKGPQHPQPQLQTPATPIAPIQDTYAAVPSHSMSSYIHTMGVTGPGGMYMPSSGGNQPTNQTIFGASGIPSMGYSDAGQSRLTSSTGGRPHTMPITSPSPTPGASNRVLGGGGGGSGSGSLPRSGAYTTSYANHQGSGIPISTVAQYKYQTSKLF